MEFIWLRRIEKYKRENKCVPRPLKHLRMFTAVNLVSVFTWIKADFLKSSVNFVLYYLAISCEVYLIFFCLCFGIIPVSTLNLAIMALSTKNNFFFASVHASYFCLVAKMILHTVNIFPEIYHTLHLPLYCTYAKCQKPKIFLCSALNLNLPYLYRFFIC